MTLSEFKAWFEGFSEGIDKAPTEKQFAKIKAKVALIDGAVTTYPVFIDRYRTYLDGIWTAPDHYPYRVSYTIGTQQFGAVGGGLTTGAIWQNSAAAGSQTFDSHAAMNALGRAEALN